MKIRENMDTYLAELRAWLSETADVKLEGMADFFAARIDGYEEHMSVWKDAYAHLPGMIPEGTQTILDLGCGTGLEIDQILAARPDMQITGVDLSETMLGKLREKHPHVQTICADYFEYDLGEACFDAAVSFESLHHFKPGKKQRLFEKIFRALKGGGVFILADYLACCDEEEELLMSVSDEKRQKEGIPPDVFVHFDTPLTAEHEMELLRAAGFSLVEFVTSIEGASFLTAEKA